MQREPALPGEPIFFALSRRYATVSARHYRQIAEKFDAAARTGLERDIGIAGLCRIVGVERHTLLRAVRAIHATTPAHYLRALRLNLAREALMAPDANSTTVTEVATRFGFRELGRFAGEYRAAFGESALPGTRLPRYG